VATLEPLAPAQLELEGGALSDEGLGALVDRLTARLGRGRVRRLAPRDSHQPEQAAFSFPAAEPRATPPWPTPAPGEPPLRPLSLFDPPEPVEVIAEVPDGPPRRFRWRGRAHDVALSEGPERIAAPWWLGDPDAPPPPRDYYRVEDMAGRRFWLFRHGLYGAATAPPRWWMHGLFA
jgi:protein ImuB